MFGSLEKKFHWSGEAEVRVQRIEEQVWENELNNEHWIDGVQACTGEVKMGDGWHTVEGSETRVSYKV